jgi:alpha-1,6-mannosyltransferase
VTSAHRPSGRRRRVRRASAAGSRFRARCGGARIRVRTAARSIRSGIALTDRGAGAVIDRQLFAPPPASGLDISRLALPPRLRSGADLGVLDITEFFGETSGGVRTYLLQKARYVERRTALRQVLLVPGAEDAVRETEGVRCYHLRGPAIPTQRPYRFMLATRSTARIVAHERPDIIEVGSTWLVPWLIRLANRELRIPTVWFYHSHFPRIVAPHPATAGWARRTASAAAWRYVRRLGGLVHATLAPCDGVARELEAAGLERVHRVSLGVDVERFHPGRRFRAEATRRSYGLPDGPLALYVGRFAREKDLDVLLAGWREVEARTGTRLVLAGDGPSRDWLRRRPGAASAIWLPFERSRDRLADLMAAVDLYMAPSPTETFGLAAHEALASGTPVVAAEPGGVAETVQRSAAGAVFPAGDAGALAEVTTALLRDDLRSLGGRGRAYVEAHHRWDAVFDRLFAIYREVLSR